MPSCATFLDVDDLDDIGKLEAYIKQSDVILIIVTDEYLSSANCRRELRTAFQEQKPLICWWRATQARATAPGAARRGQSSAGQASALDYNAAERSACSSRPIRRWRCRRSSSGTARSVALKAIVGTILNTRAPSAPPQRQSVRRVTMRQSYEGARHVASLEQLRIGGEPECELRGHRVYMCAAYRNLPLGEEVFQRLTQLGVDVSTDDDLSRVLPAVLILCPGVFGDGALVAMMERLLTAPATAEDGQSSLSSSCRLES